MAMRSEENIGGWRVADGYAMRIVEDGENQMAMRCDKNTGGGRVAGSYAMRGEYWRRASSIWLCDQRRISEDGE